MQGRDVHRGKELWLRGGGSKDFHAGQTSSLCIVPTLVLISKLLWYTSFFFFYKRDGVLVGNFSILIHLHFKMIYITHGVFKEGWVFDEMR